MKSLYQLSQWCLLILTPPLPRLPLHKFIVPEGCPHSLLGISGEHHEKSSHQFLVLLWSVTQDTSDMVDQTFLLKTRCLLYPKLLSLLTLSLDPSSHLHVRFGAAFPFHAGFLQPSFLQPASPPSSSSTFSWPSDTWLTVSPCLQLARTLRPVQHLACSSALPGRADGISSCEDSPEKHNQRDAERELQQEIYGRKWPRCAVCKPQPGSLVLGLGPGPKAREPERPTREQGRRPFRL